MKPRPQHRDLLFIFITLTLGAGFLIFVTPSWIYYMTYCEAWRWLVMVILFFSPLGRFRIGNDKKYSWLRLIPLTLGMQILLFLAFVASSSFLQNQFHTSTHLTLNALTINYAWYWPFIIFTACLLGLSYFTFKQNTHQGMLSQLYTPVFNNTLYDNMSLIINTLPRAAILGTFALIGSMLILSSTTLVASSLTGLKLGTIIPSSIIGLSTHQGLVKSINRQLTKRQLPPSFHFLIMILILSLIFVAISLSLQFLNRNQLIWLPLDAPPPSDYLQNFVWTYALPFFWLSWWIVLSPLLVAWVMIHFKGYTVRQIMLTTLALPVLLTMLNSNSTQWAISQQLATILTIISLTLLLFIFLRRHYVPYLFRAILPGAHEAKTPGTGPLLQGILTHTGLAFTLLAPLGPKGISIFMFIPGLALYIFSYIQCYAFGKTVFKRNEVKPNENVGLR